MDDIVFKTVLLRGAQGAQGEPGTADAIPTGGVIALDGSSVPEGFEETTIDNVPTKNSNNVVESGGIYDSEKDIYAVMGEMGAKNLIPYPYYRPSGYSSNGMTTTYDENGVMTINKVAGTATAFFNLAGGVTYFLKANTKYRLWFELENTNQLTVFASIGGTDVAKIAEKSSGKYHAEFTTPQILTGNMSVGIYAYKNTTETNAIVKVMITPASVTDDTYEPYAKTNKQLTDEIANKVDKVEGKGLSTNDYDNTEKAEVAKVAGKAEKTATASGEALALAPTSEGKALIHTAYGMSIQNGTPTPSVPVDIVSAKADFRSVGVNLLPYPYYTASYSTSTLSVTDNGDGSITINGHPSTNTVVFRFLYQAYIPLDKKKYKISFGGEHGSASFHLGDLGLYKADDTTQVLNIYRDYVLDNTDGTYVALGSCGVYQRSDMTVSNFTYRPFLSLEEVNNTYEPYKKTDLTTDLTLRAIEVSSTDNYNLVRDNKYYIADTLDYSEDNGFVVTRRIQEYVLDSSNSDDITVLGLGTTTQRFQYSVGTLIGAHFNSDKFIRVTGDAAWGGARRNGDSNAIVITDSGQNFSSLADFKTWVNTNTCTFDFELQTPTTETITTEQALTLLSLKTYDESTSISSQAEPSCTVAIEYAKERLGALTLIAHNLAKGNDLRIAELEETP